MEPIEPEPLALRATAHDDQSARTRTGTPLARPRILSRGSLAGTTANPASSIGFLAVRGRRWPGAVGRRWVVAVLPSVHTAGPMNETTLLEEAKQALRDGKWLAAVGAITGHEGDGHWGCDR